MRTSNECHSHVDFEHPSFVRSWISSGLAPAAIDALRASRRETRFGDPCAPPAGDVVHRVGAIVQSTSDAPVTAPLVPIARAMGRAGSAKVAFVGRPVKSGDFHDLERLPSICLLRGPLLGVTSITRLCHRAPTSTSFRVRAVSA